MNIMNNHDTELISLDEMCDLLSIGKNRAYEMLNNNEIKAFKIGKVWKIPRESINLYIIAMAKL